MRMHVCVKAAGANVHAYLRRLGGRCVQVFLTISILMGEGMYMVLRVLLSSECFWWCVDALPV